MRVIKRLNSTLDNANEGIDYAKDLVADLKDGVGFTIRPRKGFSKFVTRMIESIVVYMYHVIVSRLGKIFAILGDQGGIIPTLDLTWMEEQDIPLLISLDPTVDTLPPRIAKFSGGPYDGKEYVVDQSKTRLTLEGGATYVWDGKVFFYVESESNGT